MEWLAVVGLAIWVWLLSERVSTLTRKLAELEARLAQEANRGAPQPRSVEPLTLDTPVPTEPDVLLLDTPLPEPSNDTTLDTAPVSVAAMETPPEVQPTAATSVSTASTAVFAKKSRSLEKWVAENGLAWLGGALVALGGIFLVTFVAQQAWFTPPLQLASALAFGAALIAASEWVRRSGKPPSANALIGAMLAGAGVVTFYATAWAAHALYGMLDPAASGLALALCALILGALALRHGQALGVLAIAMALLAPPLASMGLWPTTGLTLYVCAVAAAGFALAAWRRWAWVATATLVGLYFWFAAAIGAGEIGRALAMASLAALGGVSLAFRQPLANEATQRLSWSRVRADGPAIAICASSVLLIWAWLSIAELTDGNIGRVAWVGGALVVLAAAAVRARAAAAASLAVAIGALVVGIVFFIGIRFQYPPLGADFYTFVLAASVVVALSALFANPHRRARALVAASGAIGAALLALLAATTRDDWHGLSAWLPLFATALILFACARYASASAQAPHKDRGVAFWAGAGAVLLMVGVESAIPAQMRSMAHALVALLLAAGFLLRGWGILRFAALTAAALTIGHAFSDDLVGAALTNTLPLWSALLILAAAAVLLLGASRLTARAEPHALTAEGLSAASIIVALTGGFLALRWFAAGGAGAAMDPFTENALRACALSAAGFVLLPRPGQTLGFIAKWRGFALMGIGILHALAFLALWVHPWWGGEPAQITGPPVFNAMALAFAGSAVLAALAARNTRSSLPAPARILGGAGATLALVWVVSELRRAFHGADMAYAPVDVFEAACFALAFLAAALGVAFFARGREASDLAKVARPVAWAAIIASALILLVLRHPWWGPESDATGASASILFATLSQAAAAVLALLLGRLLSQSPRVENTRFAAASATAVFAWSFGHCAIRWLYHRGASDDGATFVGLEGFAHALWPLAFVLAASALCTRSPSTERDRALVHDLQAIWSAAIWPTLAFAALGLWFVFNPWWGAAPIEPQGAIGAVGMFGAFVAGAWLSVRAHGVAHVVQPKAFATARTLSAAGHALVAATLAPRWAFHANDMSAAPITGVEMWTYSAVWALFGAGAFALGTRRNEALLRWIGLGLLLITTLKVIIIDMAQLSGFIRVGSVVGLAAILLAVAWAARRSSAKSDQIDTPPMPG